ncbi:Protein of unknown function, partial [Gryllus bimaculatus]
MCALLDMTNCEAAVSPSATPNAARPPKESRKGSKAAKLEKADILEMTVKHLQALQQKYGVERERGPPRARAA